MNLLCVWIQEFSPSSSKQSWKNISTHCFFTTKQHGFWLRFIYFQTIYSRKTPSTVHSTFLFHFFKNNIVSLAYKAILTTASTFTSFTALQFLIPSISLQSLILMANSSTIWTKARGEKGQPCRIPDSAAKCLRATHNSLHSFWCLLSKHKPILNVYSNTRFLKSIYHKILWNAIKSMKIINRN